jgi:hypothetical protein
VAIGSIRRVNIDNVVVSDADTRYASIIAGLPGHDVEDVKLSNIRIQYRGGLSLEQVAAQPANLVNTFFFRVPGGRGPGSIPPREPFATPEREKEYPEPSMFGLLPAWGFFIRHAKGIQFDNVDIDYVKEDRRPAFVLDDAKSIVLRDVNAPKAAGASTFVLMNVKGFEVRGSETMPDTKLDAVTRKEF